jgi:hypothetical protein
MKITNYMPSMPSINASTANSVYRLTLFATQQENCQDFGWSKSLGEWPANGEAALESLVPSSSSILPRLVCLPANGECILRRNQESGRHSRSGKWRADVCSRRVVLEWLG